MLQAQHKRNQHGTNSFSPNEELGELIASLYMKVNGISNRGSDIGINTALNFNIDDVLETIDRIRGPLAVKRLEGEEFSTLEFSYIKILDSLTDQLLSRLEPEPEETMDVKLALEQARRVIRNN